MLSRVDALRQVMRFAHYPRQTAQAENSSAATEALIRAFQQTCDTDAMAVAVANEVERTVQWFPVPAHVHECAGRVAEQIAEEARYSETPKTPYDEPGTFDWGDFEYFKGWTDRDVAVHEALAEQGRTKFAREAAKQALEQWRVFCAQKGDSWEPPRFDPSRAKIPLRSTGEPFCEPCLNSGWRYLGPYHVERCACRRDTAKQRRRQETKSTVAYSVGEAATATNCSARTQEAGQS